MPRIRRSSKIKDSYTRHRAASTSTAATRGTTPVFLPNVGPTADLGLVDARTLPNLGPADVASFAFNYFTVSRTSPLKRNIINLNGSFAAVVPNPSGGHGYSMFVWANVCNVGPGQGLGSANSDMPPFPDGTQINGATGSSVPTMTGGNGGSGGAGGAGGVGDDDAVGFGPTNGNAAGGNGSNGPQSGAGVGGTGGKGSCAFDLAGSPWTPFSVGGASGDGNVSTQVGCGAGGQSGGTPDGPNDAQGGGGSGASYVSIVCRTFGGTGPGTQGIFSQGGRGGNDAQDLGLLESFGGGGGIIEIFAMSYDGSFVPFVDGGSGSFGTPSAGGDFRIYEVAHDGTTILATHTDASDTWNHL